MTLIGEFPFLCMFVFMPISAYLQLNKTLDMLYEEQVSETEMVTNVA